MPKTMLGSGGKDERKTTTTFATLYGLIAHWGNHQINTSQTM